MIGRKSIVGLCMLCALVFSAFAAQSAAASTGTTAVTCKKGLTGFKDNHCKEAGSGAETWGHETFTGTTELQGTGGLTKLHSVISGVEVELQSTEIMGSGSMENMVVAGENGEHTANGTGVIQYTGVTVTKPAGKGCVVTTGEVTTQTLKATTAGQGMGLKFEPNSGTLFAEFNVTGCSIAALNGKYEVKGSVIGEPVGATTVTTAAGTTAQGTLTLRGQKAGIDGALTLDGRRNNTEPWTALAATTVTTP